MFSSEIEKPCLYSFQQGSKISRLKRSLGDMVSTRSLQRWFKQLRRCVIGKSAGRPSKSATQLTAIKMKYRKNMKKRVSKVSKLLGIQRTTFRKRLKQLDLKAYHARRTPCMQQAGGLKIYKKQIYILKEHKLEFISKI